MHQRISFLDLTLSGDRSNWSNIPPVLVKTAPGGRIEVHDIQQAGPDLMLKLIVIEPVEEPKPVLTDPFGDRP